MKIWKKSLLVTGVLAMALAGSAFAATVAEDAETQKKGLEYNKQIEQEALEYGNQAEQEGPFMHKFHRHGPRHHGFRHHGPCGGPGPHHGGFHGPHGGPGPHHDEFHGPHGGPGPHHGEFHGPHGDMENRPGELTHEQRHQLAKEREEFFANWQSMSDRERREATEKFIHRVNEERMKNMTDDEKKVFEKRQAEKKAEREKIAQMTEDERHEYFKKKHAQMVKERTRHMTKEEKERFLERDKRHQERMDAFWEKWKKMTPEEKEQWKKDHHRFGPRQGAPGPGRRHFPPKGGPRDAG